MEAFADGLDAPRSWSEIEWKVGWEEDLKPGEEPVV
jgi:hypothetical protein